MIYVSLNTSCSPKAKLSSMVVIWELFKTCKNTWYAHIRNCQLKTSTTHTRNANKILVGVQLFKESFFVENKVDLRFTYEEMSYSFSFLRFQQKWNRLIKTNILFKRPNNLPSSVNIKTKQVSIHQISQRPLALVLET